MTYLKNILLFSSLFCTLVASSQKYNDYGVKKEMPAFLNEIKKELTYPMAWNNWQRNSFQEWKDSCRYILKKAMLAPIPAPKEYSPELIAEERREGYTAKKIRVNVSAYTRADIYLLTPDKPGPHPGIVLLHDHGGHFLIGKEKMIRPFDCDSIITEDADKWAQQCYGGQFIGDYLASKGYAVICADAIFWGSRGRTEGVDKRKLSEFAGNLMGLGRCLSGIMTYEDNHLTDFFASLPEVDENRIGAMGFSMGAYRTWMLSAFTDKIKAGASICWMTVTDSQFSWEHGRENGGYANTLPEIRLFLDHPHIASLACPRPMLFINGNRDKLFHPDGVEEAFKQMRDVWKSQNADDRLKTEIWDMPHFCGPDVQKEIGDFFDQWL